MGAGPYTGDNAADAVLRVIRQRLTELSSSTVDQLRASTVPIFIPYRGFEFLGELEPDAVRPALDLLEVRQYLRLDHGSGQYGCHIWLRPRFVAEVA